MSEYILDTSDGVFASRCTGEIVRCRDCAFSKPYGHMCDCSIWSEACGHPMHMFQDDYCSLAERKSGSRDSQ